MKNHKGKCMPFMRMFLCVFLFLNDFFCLLFICIDRRLNSLRRSVALMFSLAKAVHVVEYLSSLGVIGVVFLMSFIHEGEISGQDTLFL